MRKADQITGIITLIFSGFIIEESLRMYQKSDTGFEPGVGFFPFYLGVLMAVLSIILLVSAWRSTDLAKKNVFLDRTALRSIVLIIAGITGYILLLEVLGFLLATLLLTGFLLRFVMYEKWIMTLVIASVTSGAIYLIFKIMLGIALPGGFVSF